MQDAYDRFQSMFRMRRLVMTTLWLTLVTTCIGISLDFIERSLLNTITELGENIGPETMARIETSDRNQQIWGAISVALWLASTVVWFMWIYRSNRFSRAIGAAKMTYSPGWSVGWFFIPIANLFKPYFAMKEIYLSTLDPKGFDMKSDTEDQPSVRSPQTECGNNGANFQRQFVLHCFRHFKRSFGGYDALAGEGVLTPAT